MDQLKSTNNDNDIIIYAPEEISDKETSANSEVIEVADACDDSEDSVDISEGSVDYSEKCVIEDYVIEDNPGDIKSDASPEYFPKDNTAEYILQDDGQSTIDNAETSTDNEISNSSTEETMTEDEETQAGDEETTTEDEVIPPVDSYVNEELRTIQEKLDNLNTLFENKISTDEHKAVLFDKMYNELQSYKTDLYAKLLKPFVLATISLINDTNSFLSGLGENESRKAEKYLREIPDDLIEILERCDVEQYEDESEIFNPRTQKAVKTIPTADSNLDKHIARRIRLGYRWNGVVLKPEAVHIYKYEANNQS